MSGNHNIKFALEQYEDGLTSEKEMLQVILLEAQDRLTTLEHEEKISPRKEKILRNSVRCLKCNDEIESKHTHDFKYCSCGNIGVDGGKEYLRRAGKGLADKSFEDTTIYAW